MISISQYSGKCDFFDTLEIHNYTLDDIKNNVTIYVGDSTKPLQINNLEDLIPYYPYIIGCAYFNNNEKKSVIHLSSESWVDNEERDVLYFYLKQLLRIYNRCKRKKIDFNVQDAVKEICFMNVNKDRLLELANRIKKEGKRASIDGIHLEMHEFYRKELVNEMVKRGLNPADYGYERFIGEENDR